MKLIENWRKAATFYSVQLAALIAVLGIVQVSVLPALESQLSADAYALLNAGLAVLLGVTRVIKQGEGV